jgi:lactoylglutathione lyase
MKLAHVALWTPDLDSAAAFWEKYFGAVVGAPYFSRRRPGFVSRFVELPGDGARIELMTAPWLGAAVANEHVGWDHIAVSLGDKHAVDTLAARCAADGRLVSAARETGDGYYEAVVAMPDGTRVEVTA